MNRIPTYWPEVLFALSLAMAAAYLVADVVGRIVQAILRAVVADRDVETRFVDRPRRVIRLVIFLVTAVALSFPVLNLVGYRTRFGSHPETVMRWVLDAGIRIAVIALCAYLVVRIAVIALCAYLVVRIASAAARRFEVEMSRGSGPDVIERSKRASTLGRLLQKTLSTLVLGIAALMILRELDVDITPVLTGAGIAGLAVGFGAQTLVRDIISGFFLIVEDQIRVGDLAVVNGQGELVEELNLRTIVLRDESGAVHVFPNGEVKTLANSSKDFSYYVLQINVPFDADVECAMAAMRDAAETLMHDPAFAPHILEPLDVFGVDSWEPGTLFLKARIKTAPLKQFLVGRELRKRMARVFTERGIPLPVPQLQVTIDGERPAKCGP